MRNDLSTHAIVFLMIVGMGALAGCSGGGATSGGSSANQTSSAATPLPLPVIQSFTAGPSVVMAGDSTTLSWNVSGADSVSIAPVVSVSGNSAVVAPAATTTYTLTASNANGTATRTARVVVHGPGAVLHPQYAALDMTTLPLYGTPEFSYELPELPVTSRSVTIASTGAQAGRDLVNECNAGNVAVHVPDSAGDIGHVGFGGVHDCDVTLGPNVQIRGLTLCRRPNPGSYCFEPDPPPLVPTARVRVRGGQLGHLSAHHSATDIVLDGVIINNGIQPSAGRTQTAVNISDANRVAIVNSLIRMVAVDVGAGAFDGTGFMSSRTNNVIVANTNMVTAGTRNSWGFRLSGGFNWIIMDNTTRVSAHKLVRFNDADVGYVYIKGGVWMREGDIDDGFIDSFANIGSNTTTEHIYIHDTTVHLGPGVGHVTFGAHMGGGPQVNQWEARRIHWFARSDSVVSDAVLANLAGSRCGVDDVCDYGIGSHTYTYDAGLTMPTNVWRTIDGFTNSDPDQLPTQP